MPLRFLLCATLCFATIAAGLVYPSWQAVLLAEFTWLIVFFYAIKLGIEGTSRYRFPYAAFVFCGIYMLQKIQFIAWTPMTHAIPTICDLLHPPPPYMGKEVLYQDWHDQFEVVARLGAALIAAIGTFYLTNLLNFIGRSSNTSRDGREPDA